MTTYRIAAIPGDGIGLEVMPAAISVIEAVAAAWDFSVTWTDLPWGCTYYQSTGAMMPDGGLEQLADQDAILLGAVGWPGVADHVSLWGLLIPIRRAFNQYVNLRPIRSLPGVPGPLASDLPIDLLVVRENSEGEYSEIGGRLFRGTSRDMAVQEAVFTRIGVQRVARYALELSMSRRRSLVSATKSNGIIHTMPFWDEMVAEAATCFPDVAVTSVHVDALAAGFVLHPERLDVVVASNLFGDILTDLGAAVVGGIGIAPSANINPEREHPSMFEPIHGSAPDIAGQGIANPVGQIWSAAMMLDHLGETGAAAAVVQAMESVLRDSDVRTRDLGGVASTSEMTGAVLGALSGPRPAKEPVQ